MNEGENEGAKRRGKRGKEEGRKRRKEKRGEKREKRERERREKKRKENQRGREGKRLKKRVKKQNIKEREGVEVGKRRGHSYNENKQIQDSGLGLFRHCKVEGGISSTPETFHLYLTLTLRVSDA